MRAATEGAVEEPAGHEYPLDKIEADLTVLRSAAASRTTPWSIFLRGVAFCAAVQTMKDTVMAVQTLQTNQPVLDLDTHGRRDVQVQVNGPNDVTLTMTNLTIRDTALSRAEFLDGSLVFDILSPNGRYVPDLEASQIARMYYTALGRAPEFAGAKYWVEDVMEARNVSIQQLAPVFYESREFKARYGENTTDRQFVEILYQNVLGRSGEEAGINFWTDRLASGAGRAEVVVGISESFEHQAARYAVIEQFGVTFLDQPFL